MRAQPFYINNDRVAIDPNYFWRPMADCPVGVKVQLLTKGGIAIHGTVTSRDIRLLGFEGWTPIPKRPD